MLKVKFGRFWPGQGRGSGAAGALSLPLESAAPAVELRDATGIEQEVADIEQQVTDLFDELRVPALRYLLSLGLSAADGEEILQEVFLALFQHLRNGRPRTSLRGWVFRTAHNLGLKRRKKVHTNPAPAVEPELLGRSADHRPNPEERLRERQAYERMRAVVNALPERDQACLSLRAEGLRYREIAEALGISLGAVSLSIQRSLARLREARP
ncbi:MAG: sigma-70 family RNA polymerase sigma factor [Acidobacteria bacterium]|nr:sigma-70 family RNA polymerase sigma factor [Acidobacteriota bacterium]